MKAVTVGARQTAGMVDQQAVDAFLAQAAERLFELVGLTLVTIRNSAAAGAWAPMTASESP